VGASWLRGLYPAEMRMPESTITALMFFDTAPAKQVLIDTFEKHIWPLYRFNSTVVDNSFVPVNGPMDVSYHFGEREVGSESEIDAYAQEVMAKPLDRAKPLWNVTTLRARQGRSALVIRVHHALSDGLGLLFAFLPLLECEDGEVLSKIPLPAALLGKRVKPPPRKPASTPGGGGGGASSSPTGSGSAVARQRPSCLATLCGGLKMFFRGVMSILAVKDDTELKFNAPVSERRPFLPYSGRHVFTRMPSVPTASIKAVRAAHGCTFNDAIMAALAGALRRYSVEDLKDPKLLTGGEAECKCFMLIGLPRPVDPRDASVSLANNILTPVCKLPIEEPTPEGRLRKAASMCNDLKSMSFIMGIKLTTKLITSIMPTMMMRKLASEAVSKCTANVTNLPLPDVPVKLGGQELKEVQVVFVNTIPQISMLSYNGHLHWNMISDPQRIPDPGAVGRYFLEEFQQLAKSGTQS